MHSEKRNRLNYTKQESEMKLKQEERKINEMAVADVTFKIENPIKEMSDPRLAVRKLKFQEMITLPNATTCDRSPDMDYTEKNKSQTEGPPINPSFENMAPDYQCDENQIANKKIHEVNEKDVFESYNNTDYVVECEASEEYVEASKEMNESDQYQSSVDKEELNLSNTQKDRENKIADVPPPITNSNDTKIETNMINKNDINSELNFEKKGSYITLNEENQNNQWKGSSLSNQSKKSMIFIENKKLDTYQINPPTDVTMPDLDPKKKEAQIKPNEINMHVEADLNPQIDEDILVVEHRYCTACNLEQPLRTKHCDNCKKCIACYDHHCPWLGNCIGQKNHLLFYWYIIFQFVELTIAEVELLISLKESDQRDWQLDNILKLFLAMINGYFFLMVGGLLVFHSYLILFNMTTWERLSWKKITYLKEWNIKWGYPFSRGPLRNIWFFCCYSKKEIVRWNMPRYKRPLNRKNGQNKGAI